MVNSSSRMSATSRSTAEIRIAKLAKLVSCHEQMKIAYHHLESQIKAGLLEAEEVFTSLAIPLTKLVGLKTMEMAGEGRFSAVIVDPDLTHRQQRPGIATEPRVASPIQSWEEESYANKATIAGKELVKNQQTQFIKLVRLLRQIETQVNSHRNDILQTLANHRATLHKCLGKAIYFLSTLHSENQEVFIMTLKLLRAIFDKIVAVIGSVESGVEDLMQDLAEQMCDPMVEYVKGLKADIKHGFCAQLLASVEEMEKSMINGRLQLEEARKKVEVAEEGKIEALCKLKEMEERVGKMKDFFRLSTDAKKIPIEQFAAHKFLGKEENQENDDKLLWKLLKRKRKYQISESPKGPNELICYERKHKSTGVMTLSIPSGHRPAACSCLNARIPLGSSPSASNQQAFRRRRISH